MSKALMGQSGH